MSKVVLTLALAASALLAQAPSSGRLVRLYPVATDANGEPITDLTPADFKIVDQNKPETILSFHKPDHDLAPSKDV